VRKHVNVLIINILLLSFIAGCSSTVNSESKVTDKMNKAISKYILNFHKDTYVETDRQVEKHKVYGIDQVGDSYKIYMYSLYEGYNFNTKDQVQSGHSFPVYIELKEDGNSYTVSEYKEPESGENYSSSVKEMFPAKYEKMALDDTSPTKELKKDIDREIKKWLNDKSK
jgi:hypothetical protein